MGRLSYALMNNQISTLLMAILAVTAIAAIAFVPVAQAAEVNSAHDADQGNGNEKSFGTCKQEARNDQACIAKK